MGGGHTEETQLKGIQLQTSSYGLPIPIVYGTARLSANLIWYGNFQAIPHETSSGGKGGGFTSTSYTYKVAAMMALCEGPIAGIGSVWKGKDKSDLTTLGLTLFTGAQGQATWSWLTGYATPGAISSLYGISYANLENLMGYHGQTTYNPEALNYSSTAYLAASSYDLGTTTSIPNHGFEIQGLDIFGGTVSDANPSVVINDFLTNAEYGAGFSSGWLASLTNYSNYCLANGLFISPSLSAQKAAADIVKEWTDATNTALVWSEGVLKFIPYGDSAASKTINATVYSFTPNTTPLYDLTDDDFVFNSSQDPIKVDRITPADAFNRVQIEYLNRANQYNSEVVDVKDQRDIELYGLRTQPSIKMDFVCDSSVAKQVAQLILQRALYIRNTYEFQLGWEYSVLEPMDLVTLTDAALGLSKTPVRITEISEDVDGLLTVKAEDFPLGTASATLYPHDNGIRYQARINDSPSSVATPQFFEAPSASTTTGLQVWAAVGGQPSDALYGGCTVWVSLDGTNYKATGKLYGPSRYGVTTASLAAHAAGTDATSTLSLALSGNGQLNSATSADLAAGASLVAVGQEYLAFQTATLTGTLAYNLTTLNRGLYSTNSAGGAHALGSAWARIDSAIGKSDNLAMSMVGKTIYFKFTAFNVYGGGEQSLASVTAYTYPITGYMTALPPSNVASLSSATDAALTVTLTWPAVSDLDIGGYELRDGATWSSATVLGQVKGTTYKIGLVSGAHTYQVKALDVNGNYSATAATTSVTVSTSSAVTSLSVSAVTVSGSAGTQSPAFNISWTAANSAIIQSTAVEYKKSSDTAWIAYANVTPPTATAQIVGIEPATSYDVRVAELYNNGIKSAYATSSANTSSSAQTVAAVPWTGVTGTAKPADNATADLHVIAGTNTIISGNSASKTTGGAAFDAGAYSAESYADGCYISFQADQTNTIKMVGIGTTQTINDSLFAYDWYAAADGHAYVRVAASNIVDCGLYATTDVFLLTYDGVNVRHILNGVVKRTTVASANVQYFMDMAFATIGASVSKLRFGPMTSNNFAAVGGATKPADNATVGAAIGTNLTGIFTTGNVGTYMPGSLALPSGVAVADGTATPRVLTKGMTYSSAIDGQVFTFNPTWSGAQLPTIIFGAGGKTYDSTLTQPLMQVFQAVGMSSSGFTASLKIQSMSGTLTTVTETAAGTANATQIKVMTKADTTHLAYDNNYKYTLSMTIANVYVTSSDGNYWDCGWIDVGFWTNDGGGWVKRTTATYNGAPGATTTTLTNVAQTVSAVLVASGGSFGLSIEASYKTVSITAFASVIYKYTSGAGATLDATTMGAIPFLVMGGNQGGL